jgi:hypothetical protein
MLFEGSTQQQWEMFAHATFAGVLNSAGIGTRAEAAAPQRSPG